MKSTILILILVSLIGCDSGSDGAAKPENPGEEVKPPASDQTTWGSLRCQKRQNCENPVLNLNYQSIKTFLEFRLPLEDTMDTPADSNRFNCGIVFISRWLEDFPQHTDLRFNQIVEIAKFGNAVIKKTECTNQPDLTKNMNEYLKNTKEYKHGN